MAVMLFGDRIGAGVLTQHASSRSLVNVATAMMELLALADMIGVQVVAGRA